MDAGIQTLSGLFGTPVSYRIQYFNGPTLGRRKGSGNPFGAMLNGSLKSSLSQSQEKKAHPTLWEP